MEFIIIEQIHFLIKKPLNFVRVETQFYGSFALMKLLILFKYVYDIISYLSSINACFKINHLNDNRPRKNTDNEESNKTRVDR